MNAQSILDRLKFEFPELNGEHRLRELILFIADRCADDPTFGMTKLNKILYFADFLSYESYGKPITGLPYIKLDNGPVPKPMRDVRDAMIAEEDIVVVKRQLRTGSREQHRICSLREPNLELFKARDIAIVDEVIRLLWGKRAKRVSELSHGIAWESAEMMGLIPYQAAYLDDNITEEDIFISRGLAHEYGW